MAYMYRISHQCDREGCRKPRAYRVCDRRNDSKGDFCKRHAGERLRDLAATEAALDAGARTPSAPLSPAEVQARHLATFGDGK